MLSHLHIENYVLIDYLDLDLGSGFSVITGETGAGKSILLGALSLVMGGRADSKVLGVDNKRCMIEATFRIAGYGLQSYFAENDWEYDDECIIRRELSPTGKSRSFLNDSPVSVAQLKELSSRLIDIHTQHSQLLLKDNGFQRHTIDTTANNHCLRTAYSQCFEQLLQLKQQYQTLTQQAAEARQEYDYWQFQYKQLEEAKLTSGEIEPLEEELNKLEHADELQQQLYQTISALDNEQGVLSQLNAATQALSSTCAYSSTCQTLHERLVSCAIELKDLLGELNHQSEHIQSDPERLETVRDRINLIYNLLQKHKCNNVNELLALEQQLKQQLQAADASDDTLQHLQQEITKSQALLQEAGTALRKSRQQAIPTLSAQINDYLLRLGMKDARFEVQMTPLNEPANHGMDQITFLFSGNKEGKLQSAAEVASGGEISRLMLCLKATIAEHLQLPTLIFDEIDTGISGETATRMGQILKTMSSSTQIIAITHLPQMAALGSWHYKVSKGGEGNGPTRTEVCPLNAEERISEIARMLSGSALTQAAINNAKALLNE